jgi:hypothetical protein
VNSSAVDRSEPDLAHFADGDQHRVAQLYLATRSPAEIAADIARDFTGKSTDERLQ